MSWLAEAAILVLFRLGQPGAAKVLGRLVLLLNFLPAAAALFVCGLLLLLGVSRRVAMSAWLLSTLFLGIPYWLWFEKKWRSRSGRKATEEVERRTAAKP